jgi:hypothetical protein
VDNGDPASLAGTYTVGPNGYYSPPKAALEIPAIREPAQVVVTYHVISDYHPWAENWGTTTITLEPPVPVFVTQFDAVSVGQRVELTWNVISDTDVRGFEIYRSIEGSQIRGLVNPDGLLSPEARKYTDSDIRAGRSYEYTLRVVLADDSEMTSQMVTVRTNANEMVLHQNHPNPFNPSTLIEYTLDKNERVVLAVYDVKGRLVRILVKRRKGPGVYAAEWNGLDDRNRPLTSGVYFYRLRTESRVLTRKAILLK